MDKHNRHFVHRNVDVKRWRLYRNATKQQLLDLHFELFYDNPSKPDSIDTILVLHPLLAGSIPPGAAIGEPKYGYGIDGFDRSAEAG